MSRMKSSRPSKLAMAVRKLSMSALVVLTFAAYAVHDRLASADTVRSVAAPITPTSAPSTTSSKTLSTSASLYNDGEYVGQTTNAYYGLVQVKAVIQDGKISDVQFLDYPSDRRLSVRINSIAMPYLTTEAIQAQSAHVNVISGATLTSLAFRQSLQSALDESRSTL